MGSNSEAKYQEEGSVIKNHLSGPSFSFEGSKFAFRYFPKQAFIIIGIFIGI